MIFSLIRLILLILFILNGISFISNISTLIDFNWKIKYITEEEYFNHRFKKEKEKYNEDYVEEEKKYVKDNTKIQAIEKQKNLKILRLKNMPVTTKELKNQYLKLSKIYHPDNLNTGDEIKFKEMSNAYNELKKYINEKEF